MRDAGTSKAPPAVAPRVRRWAPWVLVVLAAVVAYANGLDGEFLYDDLPYIVDNPQAQQGGLAVALTEPLTGDAGLGLFRPLALLSYQWQARGRGAAASPVPFHALNVALHAGVCCLLVALCLAVGMGRGAAFLAGALAAVHPAHVEAVTWIVGRAELFAALFGLAFLLVAVGPVTPRRTLLAALLWALACLGKEGAFVLPGVAFLFDVGVRRPRPAARALVLRYGAWTVVLGLLAAWRLAVLDGSFGPLTESSPFVEATARERLAITPNLLGEYLRALVWPWPQRIFHHATEFLAPRPWALGMVAVYLVAAFALRRHPLRRWWLWCLPLALLPVLNLRLIQETWAERFLYLPSLFFCPLLAEVLLVPLRAEVTRTGRFGSSLALPGLVLCAGIGGTWAGNADFHDAIALWRHNLAVSPPDIPFPHYQMAYFQAAHGIYTPRDQLRGARDEYEEALRLHDAMQARGERGMQVHHLIRTLISLGDILSVQLPAPSRDPVRAARYLRRALEIGWSTSGPGMDEDLGRAIIAFCRLRFLTKDVTAAEARQQIRPALERLVLPPEMRTFLEEELARVEQELAGG